MWREGCVKCIYTGRMSLRIRLKRLKYNIDLLMFLFSAIK